MEKLITLILILSIFFVFFKDIDNFELFEQYYQNIKKTEPKSFDPKNTKTITFQKGKYTSGNRNDPILQLNCVGGNACNKSDIIDSVQCTNVGTNDSNDSQWKCTVELPQNLSIGKTNVNCEGHNNEKDKLKLVDSCGLEYTLNNSAYCSDNENDFFLLIFASFIFIIAILITAGIYAHGLPMIKSPFYSPYSPYYYGYYGPSLIRPTSSNLYSDSPTMSFKPSTSFGVTTTR